MHPLLTFKLALFCLFTFDPMIAISNSHLPMSLPSKVMDAPSKPPLAGQPDWYYSDCYDFAMRLCLVTAAVYALTSSLHMMHRSRSGRLALLFYRVQCQAPFSLLQIGRAHV